MEQKPKRDDQRDGDFEGWIDELLKIDPSVFRLLPSAEVLPALEKAAPANIFTSLKNFKTQLPQLVCLNDNQAATWKERGNTEYSTKNLDLAIMHYTRALLYAKSDDLLATIFNNRATVLMEQKRFRDACIDSNFALKWKLQYPKAMARRGKCLEELGFPDLAKVDLEAFEKEKLEEGNSCDTVHEIFFSKAKTTTPSSSEATANASAKEESGSPIFSLSTFLPQVPPTAKIHDDVAFCCTDKLGRHIVPTQRIGAGATIIQETPFSSAPLLEGMLTSCSYCFKRTPILYPCANHHQANRRSRGLFCSEGCAAENWVRYGKIESENPFYLICPVDTLLALRTFRENAAIHTNFTAKTMTGEGFESFKGNFDPEHISSLVQFSKELYSTADVGGKESICTALAVFFDVISQKDAEKLTKIHRQILANAFPIGCVDRVMSGSTDHHIVVKLEVGKALYGVSSLFNHSCDPNCVATLVGSPYNASLQLHVKLIRTAMDGEPLCICYGSFHKNKNHSTRSRIAGLRARYGFSCTCHACSNNVDEAVSEEMKEHYIKAADYFQKGKRLIRECNYTEAVTVLSQSLQIVFKYICPPPRPPQIMVGKTYDAIAQAYQLMGDKKNCIENVKLSIGVLEELHKEDEELIREYSKLAFLLRENDCLDEAKKWAEKAKGLMKLYYPPSIFLEGELAYLSI